MKTHFKKLVSSLIILTMLLSFLPIQAFGATVSGSEVVDYAMQFLGYPYVSAGKGPDNFDCSGFVHYVFNHFGINFPAGTDSYNTENEASAYGTVFYDMSQAEAGDLVIWSGHIAIYTGNGKCINALNPKFGVCIIDVETYNNGVLNPPHFFLRPSFYEVTQENGYYHVTFDRYDATLTYDNGLFTATMVDPDLKEKYTVNQKNTKTDYLEYGWTISFTDEKNNYQIGTYYFKTDDSTEKDFTLYQMDQYIYVEETENYYEWVDPNNISLKIEGNKLIWKFTIPDDYNIDAKNLKITGSDISKPSEEDTATKNDFMAVIFDFFNTIWNYMKKPFEFLIGLFA